MAKRSEIVETLKFLLSLILVIAGLSLLPAYGLNLAISLILIFAGGLLFLNSLD